MRRSYTREQRRTAQLLIARNIRTVREGLGISQAEFARSIEADPKWWNTVEGGHRGLSVMFLIEVADALQTTISRLVEGV